MIFSVYFVCRSVLSVNKLKLHKTLGVKNIFIREIIISWLTFNPEFASPPFQLLGHGNTGELNTGRVWAPGDGSAASSVKEWENYSYLRFHPIETGDKHRPDGSKADVTSAIHFCGVTFERTLT